MKTYYKRAAVSLLSISIILFFFILNRTVILIKINDIGNYLRRLDIREKSIDNITLIITYETHKKLYEERITQEEADITEQKLNFISYQYNEQYGNIARYRKPLLYPFLMIININRRVIGKDPVTFDSDEPETQLDGLNNAYYLERNLLFRSAAEKYSKVLHRNDLSPQLESNILLRQGYCYAMAGNNEKAISNFSRITRDFSQESSAVTATILTKYLEGFIAARNRVLKDDSNSLSKGKKLMYLLAYEQALEVIDSSIEGISAKERAQIEYFRARCYSGLGEPQKAVESYINSITADPASDFAKYSNRKLYLIGVNAGGDNSVLKLSREINTKINDPVLNKSIEDYSLIKQENTVKPRTESVTDSSDVKDNEKQINNLQITVSDKQQDRVKSVIHEKPAPAPQSGNPAIRNKQLIVRTADGNVFRGTLIKKDIDSITLQTSIGRIVIKNADIVERTEKE